MRFWNTTVHSSVESPCSSYTLNFSIVLLQGFVCSSLFFFFSSRRRHTRYIGDLESRRVLFRSVRASWRCAPGACHRSTTAPVDHRGTRPRRRRRADDSPHACPGGVRRELIWRRREKPLFRSEERRVGKEGKCGGGEGGGGDTRR